MTAAGAADRFRDNPSIILFDTDALLQVLLAQQMALLHALKRAYRVQPAIVEAVEMEVRKSKKFRARFTKELQKAIDSETIVVLDTRTLPAFISTDAAAMHDTIQTKGFQYNRVLDYGEAYTFAAAVVLNVPAVSNDITALRAGSKAQLNLPKIVLRAFDFFVFCHQSDLCTAGDCDRIRQSLATEREWIPAAFQNTSYEKGLPHFYARLLDGTKAGVGADQPRNEPEMRVIVYRSDAAKSS